jgi:hypothetical protein
MGVWTDRIKRAGEALLGAHELDTVNGISKALPTGAVPRASMAADADRMTGRAPSLGITGEPAMGDPVNPGPRPVESERVDVMGEPQRWQFPYAYNQTWTPRRYALTPFQTLRMMADVADIMPHLHRDPQRSRSRRSASTSSRATRKRRRPTHERHRRRQGRVRAPGQKAHVPDLAVDGDRRDPRHRRAVDLPPEDAQGRALLVGAERRHDDPAAPRRQRRHAGAAGDRVPPDHLRPSGEGRRHDDRRAVLPPALRAHAHAVRLQPDRSVLLTINAALNREMFNLRYYTDGNIPHALMDAPKDWNKEQIQQFQNYLDEYFSGDLAARRRMKVVANGMAGR